MSVYYSLTILLLTILLMGWSNHIISVPIIITVYGQEVQVAVPGSIATDNHKHNDTLWCDPQSLTISEWVTPQVMDTCN